MIQHSRTKQQHHVTKLERLCEQTVIFHLVESFLPFHFVLTTLPCLNIRFYQFHQAAMHQFPITQTIPLHHHKMHLHIASLRKYKHKIHSLTIHERQELSTQEEYKNHGSPSSLYST